MKYCSHCGKELLDESVICPGCGCPTGFIPAATINNTTPVKDDASAVSGGLFKPFLISGIMAFILGCVGSITGNTLKVNGFYRVYDDLYNLLCNLADLSANIFIGLIIAGIILIILGFVFKKKAVNEKLPKMMLKILLPVIVIISIFLSIPILIVGSYL